MNNMTRAELENKVLECVAITFHKSVEELSVETNFKADLGGASILMVGLASLIENELDVLVPLPTVATCKIVKDLVDKVEAAL